MIEWLDKEISRRIDLMPPFRSPSDPDPRELSVTREDRQDCILLVVHGDMDVPAEGQLLAAAHGASRELSGRPLVLGLSRRGCAGSGVLSDLLMIDQEVNTRGARRGCAG
jgi:hypothetical protein